MPESATPPRILVIDDDAAVCVVICDALRDCGYRVLCAANGELGLESIRLDGAPDLVITDIVMPRKEGLETIRELRTVHPGIKIIAMSGGGGTGSGIFWPWPRNSAAMPRCPSRSTCLCWNRRCASSLARRFCCAAL